MQFPTSRYRRLLKFAIASGRRRGRGGRTHCVSLVKLRAKFSRPIARKRLLKAVRRSHSVSLRRGRASGLVLGWTSPEDVAAGLATANRHAQEDVARPALAGYVGEEPTESSLEPLRNGSAEENEDVQRTAGVTDSLQPQADAQKTDVNVLKYEKLFSVWDSDPLEWLPSWEREFCSSGMVENPYPQLVYNMPVLFKNDIFPPFSVIRKLAL
ncbi:hypothetical protein A0H81_07131 [Grifola frondosa]|uniref:Uncharacterized protein n=1 Tax=Grifola frondosa TaxID=5627 RepID=A0A1C7M9W8_GRIFR|nr:hypothetical protein A0H81_07131 [Grifola frondosa]